MSHDGTHVIIRQPNESELKQQYQWLRCRSSAFNIAEENIFFFVNKIAIAIDRKEHRFVLMIKIFFYFCLLFTKKIAIDMNTLDWMETLKFIDWKDSLEEYTRWRISKGISSPLYSVPHTHLQYNIRISQQMGVFYFERVILRRIFNFNVCGVEKRNHFQ